VSRLLLIPLGLGAVLAAVGAWLYTPDLSRAALEAKYGVRQGDYMDVAGLRLHMRDTGPRAAPAVIMLHGFGSSLQTWDYWAAGLAANHRVIAYDLPGFGLTGTDPTGDYSDDRSVAVLLALMDKLGIARASLIGNSLGGKIAWNFALKHQDRVEKLVLVSPDGFASEGFDYEKTPSTPFIMKILPYVLPKPLLRATLAPAYGDPAALTEPLMTRYHDMMRAPGVRAATLARMSQVMLHDPTDRLPRIKIPVLLIWGEKDAMIPFSNSADYLRLLPHASLAPFPGLGHVPQEEAPAVSLGPVEAFLAP
jgi:pimeloyl-ACP methyl ester carboxylesterase